MLFSQVLYSCDLCSTRCALAGQLPYVIADCVISYLPKSLSSGYKGCFERVKCCLSFALCGIERCSGGGWIGVDNWYDSFGIWDPDALSNEITCFSTNSEGILEVYTMRVSQEKWEGSVELSAWKAPAYLGGYCLVAVICKKLCTTDGSGWYIASDTDDMTRYEQRFTEIFGVSCTTMQAATMLINPCMAELTCGWIWLPKEKARYNRHCSNSSWMIAPHTNSRNILDAIKKLYYQELWSVRYEACRGYKADDTPEVRHFFKAFNKFQKLDAVFPLTRGTALLWTRRPVSGKAGGRRQCQAKGVKSSRTVVRRASLKHCIGPKLIMPSKLPSTIEFLT